MSICVRTDQKRRRRGESNDVLDRGAAVRRGVACAPGTRFQLFVLNCFHNVSKMFLRRFHNVPTTFPPATDRNTVRSFAWRIHVVFRCFCGRNVAARIRLERAAGIFFTREGRARKRREHVMFTSFVLQLFISIRFVLIATRIIVFYLIFPLRFMKRRETS